MRREPLLTRGAIVTLATAVLAALVVFGVHFTRAEEAAILAVVAAAAPLLVAFISRPKVTPNEDVAAVRGRFGLRPVVAGPASSAPNGTLVRVVPVGSPPD